jgi:hypothetical protein
VLLDYDIRIPNDFLMEQRRFIEKGWGSRMYDVSAWSIPLAYGLESYISKNSVGVKTSPVSEIGKSKGAMPGEDPQFGYMIDYQSDAATYFLADAFRYGLKMRAARKPLTIDGLSFSRGSILFVVNENPDSLKQVLDELSGKHGPDRISADANSGFWQNPG